MKAVPHFHPHGILGPRGRPMRLKPGSCSNRLARTHKGTIESATTMKGTATYEGFDDNATWSTTKK